MAKGSSVVHAFRVDGWTGERTAGIVDQLPGGFEEALKEIDRRVANSKPIPNFLTGRVVGRAWDSLIEWFGEEIVPELEAMTVRQLIEIYLGL